jgi:hypothetical protein
VFYALKRGEAMSTNRRSERPEPERKVIPVGENTPETRGIVTDVVVPIVAPIAGAYATHKLSNRKPKPKK